MKANFNKFRVRFTAIENKGESEGKNSLIMFIEFLQGKMEYLFETYPYKIKF